MGEPRRDDEDDVVTKGFLRKELERYPTKEDLKQELERYPTKEDLKQELKQELERYPTKEDLKQELKQELERYPTKEDLKQELERFATKDDLNEAVLGLMGEISRVANIIIEQIGEKIAVVDEKYQDLPARMTAVELRQRRRKK